MNPRLNKGTAFTEAERDIFALHGLLPPHIGTLEDQRSRRKRVLDSRPTAFGKYSNLRDLQDNNETLFYSLIAHNIEELLPIVYTPTVGEGCQRFSEIWRKPRGLFLSYPNKDRIEQILANSRYDAVRCIVVSDGERILGLGDQGAGGMGIPIGKMSLYTALGGIPPEHCLPVLLDVGTDNETLLNDPIYIGWEHKRIRGQEYDDFVEAFVTAVQRRWPHVLLQWEDFAGANAARLLAHYRDQLCTFNDDIQGTAAVTTATLLAAVSATGIPLRDQTIAMFGTGSAGIGIINLLIAAMREEGLTEEMARKRIYAFNRYGLLVEGGKGIRPEQEPLARKARRRSRMEAFTAERRHRRHLTARRGSQCRNHGAGRCQRALWRVYRGDCARDGAPHTASGHLSACRIQPRNLKQRPPICCAGPVAARWWARAVPSRRSRSTANLSALRKSTTPTSFPGLALGILVSRAARVTDGMIMAAAKALASLSPARADKSAPLLPPIGESRQVSLVVAEAVGRQAVADGVTGASDQTAFAEKLRAYMWEPVYQSYERVDSAR